MKRDRASATAEVIAASTLLLDTEPSTASLIAPGAAPLCEVLLSDGARGRFLRWSARNKWMRPLWRHLERVTLPGITRHYWLRKQWIEARVRTQIAGGVRRVVVLGAGLDTLALRLAPLWPDVDWIEVDHPATQAMKQRALDRAGIKVPPTLRFVAADLAINDAWPDSVGAGPHCDGQLMVWSDWAGFTRGRIPKFVKRYANIGETLLEAAKTYREEVEAGIYPAPEHEYSE